MKKWKTPRKKLLEIALDLVVNRGLDANGVAETTIRNCFYGLHRQSAQRRFLADLEPLVAAGIRSKNDAYFAELRAKECQLIAEGWRWVGYRGEGFFRHDDSGYEVNKAGGVFANKERAILATWNSTSRALLLEKASC